MIPQPTHSTIKYENKIEPYVVAQNPVTIPHKKVLTGRYIPNNCVLFARSIRPDLPMNLYSLSAKKKIITHSKPEIHDVAVTPESWAGHLSIVIKVERENILVRESGYGRGISERWISIDKILGFY